MLFPSASDLEGFRTAQRLGFRAATEVAAQLREGITEQDAAVLLRDVLVRGGTRDWFHVPFAWFGERSAFEGMRGYRDYLPSRRALKPGEVAVLDVSPIVDGYVGDIGLTCALGEHVALERAKGILKDLRREIPFWFESNLTLGEIWRCAEQKIELAGYTNRFRRYPFAVLGHRVMRLRRNGKFRFRLPLSYLSWFGASAYLGMLREGIYSQLIRSRSKQTKIGLWAIEPHLGAPGFGAKFEEILVYDGVRAQWLDNEVPHA